LNGWHHPFEIFRQPFEWLVSPVRNFSLAVRMAGVIRSKFFISCSNGSRHPFKNFPVPFKRLASSVRNFSSAVRTFTASVRNFFLAVRAVFEIV